MYANTTYNFYLNENTYLIEPVQIVAQYLMSFWNLLNTPLSNILRF